MRTTDHGGSSGLVSHGALNGQGRHFEVPVTGCKVSSANQRGRHTSRGRCSKCINIAAQRDQLFELQQDGQYPAGLDGQRVIESLRHGNGFVLDLTRHGLGLVRGSSGQSLPNGRVTDGVEGRTHRCGEVEPAVSDLGAPQGRSTALFRLIHGQAIAQACIQGEHQLGDALQIYADEVIGSCQHFLQDCRVGSALHQSGQIVNISVHDLGSFFVLWVDPLY